MPTCLSCQQVCHAPVCMPTGLPCTSLLCQQVCHAPVCYTNRFAMHQFVTPTGLPCTSLLHQQVCHAPVCYANRFAMHQFVTPTGLPCTSLLCQQVCHAPVCYANRFAIYQWTEVFSILLIAALLATQVEIGFSQTLVTAGLLAICPGVHVTMLVSYCFLQVLLSLSVLAFTSPCW